MTDRVLKSLSAGHTGSVGVLLTDGSEPDPVYFDVGSGAHMPSSTDWHAYDGRMGRPRAAVLRGSCSCGWRGPAHYPLDWSTLEDGPLWKADIDLSGPTGDIEAHVSVVRDQAVPLPDTLTELLTGLTRELSSAVEESPLVVLKAIADLRYLMAEVATALGTSEQAACSFLADYHQF
ncbi:hypothetical protein ACIQWR_38740 [Streptomyces sp. NPDC098789]|uniref:hypothetical protein n=1 Tax=Streptomyces sp. NPDC098789 TaxID=3366098 RepID=UPI0038260539